MPRLPSRESTRKGDTPRRRLPRPDWNKWRFIVEALPHDVVALSCDISPEALHGGIKANLPDEYLRRDDIVDSHLESGMLKVVVRGAGMFARNYLNLVEFAIWAGQLGWELPAEFPKAPLPLRTAQVEVPALPADAVPKAKSASSDTLGTRERGTLLAMIGALARMAEVDIEQPTTAAKKIVATLDGMGAHVGLSTVEKHLKAVPDALERKEY